MSAFLITALRSDMMQVLDFSKMKRPGIERKSFVQLNSFQNFGRTVFSNILQALKVFKEPRIETFEWLVYYKSREAMRG
jgi:hypothetical protein